MSDRALADQIIIPEALCEREQWVCWKKTQRDGKATKIPVTPGGGGFASSTDPETWTDFEIALEYVQKGKADGVGFVFTEADPIVGVDLDDCRDPQTGHVDSEAQDIIDRLDSYTEISPSGAGYHVLIEGELPEGRNRRGHIELYDTARFFTVTGDHVQETPTHIARRQDALVAIHREYVQGPRSDEKSDSPNHGGSEDHSESIGSTDPKVDNANADLDDEKLLEKARRASNGPKFERLWGGTLVGMRAIQRLTWPCVVYWPSGVVATRDKWIACSVSQDSSVRNGTRSTLPMDRLTARRPSSERFRTPRSSTIQIVGTDPSSLKSRVNHRVRLKEIIQHVVWRISPRKTDF